MRNKPATYDPRGFNPNRKTIYLDLDNTLTDFNGHMSSYNAVAEIKITKAKVGELSSAWWSSMPWSSWGKDLYDFCVERAYTCILSSAGGHPEAAKGKTIWLSNNGIKDYILSGCKWACANPASLLIDDTQQKVDRFKIAGGNAILFDSSKLDSIYKQIDTWVKGV